ncbi:MAG: hypothetical protein MUC78_02575 [Bacteroidales bacterium]|jgi:hypothetical protein|nr:hypothetical protein [Bacteroidales bacterium]
MKNILVSMLLLIAAASASAQDNQKAITREAARLFADKDDAMSVIMIVPKGSVVEILSLDSLYFKVSFEGTEGFVKSDGLDLDSEVVETSVESVPAVVPQPQAEQPVDRYQMLVMKYGEDIGKRLYQNKVWKGITAEMATDSWGKPIQLNRMFVDQNTDEEWIYSKKWLYFRNGILINWGPVK